MALAIAAVLGIILGSLTLIVVGIVVNGFVLSILWGWFMVPTLGLPALSVVQAIGISLLVRVLTYQHQQNKDDDKKKKHIWEALGFVVLFPVLALFTGWIVHLFL